MKLWTLLLPFLLAACASPKQDQPVVPDVPLIPPKTEVVIPKGLTAACEPLKPLTNSVYTQGETLEVLKGWFDQYDSCASRFSTFVNLVAPALKIKEVGDQNPTSDSK